MFKIASVFLLYSLVEYFYPSYSNHSPYWYCDTCHEIGVVWCSHTGRGGVCEKRQLLLLDWLCYSWNIQTHFLACKLFFWPRAEHLAAIPGLEEGVCASKLVFFPPVPGAWRSCPSLCPALPPPPNVIFVAGVWWFLVVGLGCVSLGGPAGLLALPGRRPGLLGRVGGSSLPGEGGRRPCWGSVPPRCFQPSPEVRICPGGEVCAEHVGLLPSRNVFSVLNAQ